MPCLYNISSLGVVEKKLVFVYNSLSCTIVKSDFWIRVTSLITYILCIRSITIIVISNPVECIIYYDIKQPCYNVTIKHHSPRNYIDDNHMDSNTCHDDYSHTKVA